MSSQARAQKPKQEAGRELRYSLPYPRALPQATPTYAGMPLGTRGREHARKRARVGSRKRNHFAILQATLDLRKHAREDEVARMQCPALRKKATGHIAARNNSKRPT